MHSRNNIFHLNGFDVAFLQNEVVIGPKNAKNALKHRKSI